MTRLKGELNGNKKDLKRFCGEQDGCMGCGFAKGCADGIDNFPDNADDIVDKWTEEHTECSNNSEACWNQEAKGDRRMKTITIELHDGYSEALTFVAVGTTLEASGNRLTNIRTVGINLKDLDGKTIVVNSDGNTETKENAD